MVFSRSLQRSEGDVYDPVCNAVKETFPILCKAGEMISVNSLQRSERYTPESMQQVEGSA